MQTKLIRGSTAAVLLAVSAVGGFAAQAHADQTTGGSGGVASGNQINLPVDVAVDVCGNSVAVGGVSRAECVEVAEGLAGSEENQPQDDGGGQSTDGSGGIASGNQVNVPVSARVNVCGNAIAVLGIATADCRRPVEESSDSGDLEENGEEAGEGERRGPEEEPEESQPADERADAAAPPSGGSAPALPVTGSALGGLIAAALALVATGAVLVRRWRAAPTGPESRQL